MADNEKVDDQCGRKLERNVDRFYTRSTSEQRTPSKIKYKVDETDLPTPPPDPWIHSWPLDDTRSQMEITRSRNLTEDDDILAYLADFGTSRFEDETLKCPSRDSVTSNAASPNFSTEDAFEHLDRLYAFTEQILELRSRNSKFFKRVRNLERLKVLRNANQKLKNLILHDKDALFDFCDEDTGFAESLLDAMLSNCKDQSMQKKNIRLPSSRLTRNKFDVDKQTSIDEIPENAPKVSKWTRVKAAFKWERAYTNDTEIVDSTMITTTTTATATTITTTSPLSTPIVKHQRIPDAEIGELNSIPTNDSCDVGTPFCRTWSPSSSNEGSYDCMQRNALNHVESLKENINEKVECTDWHHESLHNENATLDTEQINDTGLINEVNQGKPIQIASGKQCTMHLSDKINETDAELLSKRSTPTLTITIPSHDEDIRCTSSPESISPLSFTPSNSGENSSQYKKTYQLSTNKDFKQQQSVGQDSAVVSSNMRRRDSKWNKVRRAFLTNSTLSVPSNAVSVDSRQTFLQNGPETPVSSNYTGSVDDIGKTISLNSQADARQDYHALKEKFGTEFHRKLIEWERLKNPSRRAAKKTESEISCNTLQNSPRQNLVSEERLAPEFRKKLQDWKRVRKVRRGSAPLEQQRISRRRLTDWQLWRSPSKIEQRNKGIADSNVDCESGDIVNGGRSQIREDFVRKKEACKKMNETNDCDTNNPARTKSHQLGIASGIDESEFLTLEKLLSLFNNNAYKRGRLRRDARQFNECFDGDTRLYASGAQNANDGNEVLVQTSVGSYRFEGISREFARKLYDWEKYRGISPTSSTFRLLGPAYAPFARQTNIESSTVNPATSVRNNEPILFKGSVLNRSKSVGSEIGGTIQNKSFIHRSKSLQSLDHDINRLKNVDCTDTLPAYINPQGTRYITEDIMDDSEPEAMIVDIEDVIEETASPLERVQPQQTPVYSVAECETTSIAVPLGTVTSSHKLSPVYLVEVEENVNGKYWMSKNWNERKTFSSEENLSMECVETSNTWSDGKNSSNYDDINLQRSSVTNSFNKRTCGLKDNTDNLDSTKSDNSISSMELNSKCSFIKTSRKTANQNYTSFERTNFPVILPNDEITIGASAKKVGCDERNEKKIVRERNLGNYSVLGASVQESMDLTNKMKHQPEGDNQGTENHGEDVAGATVERDNKYEEVIVGTVDPHCCSLTNTQLMTSYNTKTTESLLETFATCKQDKTKYNMSDLDFRYTNREDGNLRKLEDNYGVIRDEPHNTCCHLSKIKSNLSGNEPSKLYTSYSSHVNSIQSMERNERQEHRNIENFPASSMLCAMNSSVRDSHREPTIRTTAYTVTPYREERCFERILINEETLNKIVVPTASTACVEEVKTTRQPVRYSTIEDSTEEHHYQSEIDRNVTVNQTTSVKKQISSSPTRNVFIKTKRIIFSPFRRSEEHSTGKKDDNNIEDIPISMKSKSKSRSASPKTNRQDALLKMSLSLPWSLRPCSKDRETKESKIEKKEQSPIEKQNIKQCKSMRNSKESLTVDNDHLQTETKSETSVLRERSSSIESARKNGNLKQSVEQKNQRASVSVQVTPDEQQENSVSSRNEKKKNESTSSSKFDPRTSDLLHKLKILSNVATKKNGRTKTITEDSPVESHSSRIRRAKEDFLFRQNDPLPCFVLESPKSEHFLKPPLHHYEHDLEHRETMRNKHVSDASTISNMDGTLDDQNVQQGATKDDNTEEFVNKCNVNELSNNLAVSRSDRVKSASAGMINIDPDTFVRLTETSRGCESLPRSISKQQQSLGPFAKIISKFKFTRLIRGKDEEEENMSTISKLCRQSLLIDVRNDFEKARFWNKANDQEKISKMESIDKTKRNE
ncbi:hypothetical protein ANTQUA_LOCUS5714 [Anthophora quadrimaculata]